MLAEKPIEAVSIDEIVEAAGVAKGSFYYYFADKVEFAHAIADDIDAEISKNTVDANNGIDDPASRIARAVCLYLHFAHKDPIRARIMVRWQTDPSVDPTQLNKALVDQISLGLVNGRFRLATAEAGALSVLGIAGAGIRRLSADACSIENATAISQQLCAFMLRGLGLRDSESNQLAARAAHEIFLV